VPPAAPSVTTTNSEPDALSEREANVRTKGKAGVRFAVRPLAHGAVPALAPSVAAAPNAAVPAAKTESPSAPATPVAAPKPSANAWDPSTFGNRY
jgi:hypothetical protein